MLWITTKAVTLDCYYRIYNYDDEYGRPLMRNMYLCTHAEILSICGDSNGVVAISNNHKKGKTNADVKVISFEEQMNVSRIRRNLGRFFPSTEGLMITSNEILEISSHDLEQFPKFRFLNLAYNNLTILEGDLFKFTPNIEYLALQSNQITNIGLNLLDNLKSLRIVYFDLNICTSFIDVID